MCVFVYNIPDSFAGNSQCECPDPCDHTVYEPILSYASISASNLDGILSERVKELQRNYDNVLEANERVTKDTFVTAVQDIKEVSDSYKDLLTFVSSYLGSSTGSVFSKLWTAMGTIVKLFQKDMGILFEEIPSFVKTYDDKFIEFDITVTKYLREIGQRIKDIVQILKLISTSHTATESLKNILEGTQTYTKITREMAEKDKQLRIEFRKSQELRSAYKFFQLNSRPDTCSRHYTDLISTLNSLDYDLTGLIKRKNFVTVAQEGIIEDFTKLDRKYSVTSEAYIYCLKEYGDVIHNISSWNHTVSIQSESKVKEMVGKADNNFGLRGEFDTMLDDWKSVQKIYRKYQLAELTRHELLEKFASGPGDERLAGIKKFTSTLKDKVTNDLQGGVDELKEQLSKHYYDGLSQAGRLENHKKAGYFYEKGRTMNIWQLPVADLENPEKYSLQGQEVWKIWNRDLSTDEFVKRKGEEFINAGLNKYTEDLDDILNGFDKQLFVYEKNIERAMAKLKSEYDAERKKRQINKEFAQ